MVIPDYLIYDELRRREEAERDGGLLPLHLPLYQPEIDDLPRERDERDEEAERGVIIIDMNTGDVIDD